MEILMDTPCIDWQQSVGSHGYGQTWDGTTVVLAHRVAWEKDNGSIPKGLVIDHLCENKVCQNTGHMELTTIGDNVWRSSERTTHCKSGLHEWTEDNTYWNPNPKGMGRRRCRACIRLNDARR